MYGIAAGGSIISIMQAIPICIGPGTINSSITICIYSPRFNYVWYSIVVAIQIQAVNDPITIGICNAFYRIGNTISIIIKCCAAA